MEYRDTDAVPIQTDVSKGGLSRRQALKSLGAAGIAAATMPFLGGATRADMSGQLIGPGGIPLARPAHPVKLPVFEDPINSGLQPETGGTFRVFMYADYIDKKLLATFGKKYDVDVEVTTFISMDQAITRLATHAVEVDAFNITPDRVAQAVAGKLLKPVNPDYIPNLKKNIWPSLHSPFYDVGSQYTVPYVAYTTGIAWRSDKIAEDIPKLQNPWSIFWNAEKYKGYVGVLDDSRESLAMAMLYRHQYDINTEDPALIDQALSELKQLIPVCNPKVNTTSYQTIPEGSSWLHQAWSGQMINAVFSYLPKGFDPSVLRYWAAPKGQGPIQNDCWAIIGKTRKPVLAHLWLNFLLDEQVAYSNFVNYTGYQPPQNSITPESLIEKKVIPMNLRAAIISPSDFGSDSLQEMSLTPKGQALWQNAYARFISGT
ncbi:MAG: spermidine/putrescine transport system substrate-binding protein [Rhodospirillaceae bacterium]|nr:spermidine/putrescine transport system substrate-binding protein [Rhodospirillaceae bacterium]